jgi:hypothetical protein
MVPSAASPSEPLITASPSVEASLRMARVTWSVMLVVTLCYLGPPLWWGLAVASHAITFGHPEALGPSGLWCEGPGWPEKSYIAAVLLLLAGTTLPLLLHHRSIARLRRRASNEMDPSRPGTYRGAPGTQPRFDRPDAARRSAAARYTARLALSSALVAPLPLLAGAHMGWHVPFTSCVLAIQCYVEPIEHTPLVLLAALVIAVQVPTRRRALRSIEDLCPGR